MLGRQLVVKRGTRDEAEKPFWISFADLMTALMVLFLVSLTLALKDAQKQTADAQAAREAAEISRTIAVKEAAAAREAKEAAERARAEAEQAKAALEEERKSRKLKHDDAVSSFLDKVEQIVRKHPGVGFDRQHYVIDFGSRAQFKFGRDDLTYEQAMTIRQFVPVLLGEIQSIEGSRKWLKRIVVEGFTDDKGGYLGNLNLSLDRSQRVMCVLLAGEYGQPRREAPKAPPLFPELEPAAQPPPQIPPLDALDEKLVRELFLVGGYSSNSQKASAEESRRIELRIEFYGADEEPAPAQPPSGDAGKCRLGAR